MRDMSKLDPVRSFARLLASDIRYGLGSAVVPRLIIVVVVALLVLFLSYTVVLTRLPHLEGSISLGEAILCAYRGILPYVPTPGIPFEFPMEWFALLLVIAYVTVDYPFRDLDGMGSHMIVASHSRWAWWLAKCAWVCCAP